MQDAVTHYVAVEHTQSTRFEWLTTVDLWPKTGRTHQLRRHMAGLGFPILGDKKYAYPDQIVVRGCRPRYCCHCHLAPGINQLHRWRGFRV